MKHKIKQHHTDVILPSASAANDQESDTENVSEQFVDEDRLFQPADELEVDYSSSAEREEDISVLSTSFIKNIPLVEIEKLAN